MDRTLKRYYISHWRRLVNDRNITLVTVIARVHRLNVSHTAVGMVLISRYISLCKLTNVIGSCFIHYTVFSSLQTGPNDTLQSGPNDTLQTGPNETLQTGPNDTLQRDSWTIWRWCYLRWCIGFQIEYTVLLKTDADKYRTEDVICFRSFINKSQYCKLYVFYFLQHVI